MKIKTLVTIVIVLLVCAVAQGRIIKNGETSVITYFVLRSTADNTGTTGATIANIDMTYTEQQSAAVKANCVAHDAVTDAWDDHEAIEVDSTNAPGLYRVDWPDAAFDGGIDTVVILSITLAGSYAEHLRVELSPSVNVNTIVEGVPLTDEQFAAAIDDHSSDIDDIVTDTAALVVTVGAAGAGLTAVPGMVWDQAGVDLSAGAPSVTEDMETKINRIWLWIFGKVITNGTDDELHYYNFADTKIAEAPYADDGTSFTRSAAGVVD